MRFTSALCVSSPVPLPIHLRLEQSALETVRTLRRALSIRSASVLPGTFGAGKGFIYFYSEPLRRFVFCQADENPDRPGTCLIRPLSRKRIKTFFIEFSERMPVNPLATRFVISLLFSRYSMIRSSADASLSCLICTRTEFACSVTTGSFSRRFRIASNAVFKPSPTSLLGGLGNLLITRTRPPFLANRSERIFLGVMCAGSRPGLSTSTRLSKIRT